MYLLEGIEVSLLLIVRILSTKDYKFQGSKESLILILDNEL